MTRSGHVQPRRLARARKGMSLAHICDRPIFPSRELVKTTGCQVVSAAVSASLLTEVSRFPRSGSEPPIRRFFCLTIARAAAADEDVCPRLTSPALLGR